MTEQSAGNRKRWDELVDINARSPLYDLPGFLAGNCSLDPLEIEEVGDVRGRTLLHLQCHFGMDTLSWSRLGADVTGVDFSEKAIALARSLNDRLGLKARFVCSDVYDLPRILDEEFDIVFTSLGVLCWLPDISNWAAVIARYLKRGGFFYLREAHPFIQVFDNRRAATGLDVRYSYFHRPEPTRWEPEGCYADPNARVVNPSFEWTHSLSDVINALLGAGLALEYLHEFPYLSHDHFPFMEKDDRGRWYVRGKPGTLPLMFSLKAVRR
jgi:SAM-dependent methyltransferase